MERWVFVAVLATVLFVLPGPGPARAAEPLFPALVLELESPSDGSTSVDRPAPKPTAPEVEIPAPLNAPETGPVIAAADTPTPETQPVPATSSAPATASAPTAVVVRPPIFLFVPEAQPVHDRVAANPVDGLRAAKVYLEGKDGLSAAQGQVLAALCEYVVGMAPAARKRLEPLVAGPTDEVRRAAFILLYLMAKHPTGRVGKRPLTEPAVQDQALQALAADLVAKAQDLDRRAQAVQVSSFESFNTAADLLLRARFHVVLANYLRPDPSQPATARQLLQTELGLRKQCIPLLLARAERRKQRIDDLAATMRFHLVVGNTHSCWGPKAVATEVNAVVEALRSDKLRADQLLLQLRQLEQLVGINDEHEALGKAIVEADKVKLETPPGPSGRYTWSQFKKFGNLCRMYSLDPNDRSGGTFIGTPRLINVVPITPMP